MIHSIENVVGVPFIGPLRWIRHSLSDDFNVYRGSQRSVSITPDRESESRDEGNGRGRGEGELHTTLAQWGLFQSVKPRSGYYLRTALSQFHEHDR